MDNMKIYNACATVPKEALKEISAGRLKGMSDINPMWRIKRLTEEFGPCGFGWWYEITEQRLEKGIDEISAFVSINLYVKVGDQISMPIPGVGGSSFLTKESSGRMYQSDECFKMALTDAIGIACKALGFASTVYYAKDRTKYDQASDEVAIQKDVKISNNVQAKLEKPQLITPDQAIEVNDDCSNHNKDIRKMLDYFKIKSLQDMTVSQYDQFKKLIEKENAKK